MELTSIPGSTRGENSRTLKARQRSRKCAAVIIIQLFSGIHVELRDGYSLGTLLRPAVRSNVEFDLQLILYLYGSTGDANRRDSEISMLSAMGSLVVKAGCGEVRTSRTAGYSLLAAHPAFRSLWVRRFSRMSWDCKTPACLSSASVGSAALCRAGLAAFG